jgi:hypothetical protein
MKAQLLFLQTLEDNPHLKSLIRTLKVGICPPTHERGDFIYDFAEVLGTLVGLECLELLRTIDTPQNLYSVEGNGNTIMRRYWRGEVGKIPSEEYPQLLSFRVDIPVGYTIYSIFQAQRRLQRLELRCPSHFYRHEDIFISPDLHKLALSGENILTTLPKAFHPTHLLLDCPASTPLWPSRFRRSQTRYLAMPSTDLLCSLEISSTLVQELHLCIASSNLTFPSLIHFGIFTSERVDDQFLQERRFLLMWSGGRQDPAKRMLELFCHFPHLESLLVMPEGVDGDWTDSILTDPKLLQQLMDCCPGLRLLLWRAHAGQKAGARELKDNDGAQTVRDEACKKQLFLYRFADIPLRRVRLLGYSIDNA